MSDLGIRLDSSASGIERALKPALAAISDGRAASLAPCAPCGRLPRAAMKGSGGAREDRRLAVGDLLRSQACLAASKTLRILAWSAKQPDCERICMALATKACPHWRKMLSPGFLMMAGESDEVVPGCSRAAAERRSVYGLRKRHHEWMLTSTLLGRQAPPSSLVFTDSE